ncbi:hypothetical protein ABE042_07385 [Viridibacillus arvi]|uniref:Uncharacterized protein n=1 Tax=Viridibacillus arvi TaxID=263475 RepID=A0A0M0LCX4_9BACL|nr:hypothetical protein [Viridibacillus arvi]KOO48846.1 hypothetical protein AMD00_10520 [Viridibacillus arvi]
MKCKYCKGSMTEQDNDRIGNRYCKQHVCVNDECKAVFEEIRTIRGVRVPAEDRWLNQETAEAK